MCARGQGCAQAPERPGSWEALTPVSRLPRTAAHAAHTGRGRPPCPGWWTTGRVYRPVRVSPIYAVVDDGPRAASACRVGCDAGDAGTAARGAASRRCASGRIAALPRDMRERRQTCGSHPGGSHPGRRAGATAAATPGSGLADGLRRGLSCRFRARQMVHMQMVHRWCLQERPLLP